MNVISGTHVLKIKKATLNAKNKSCTKMTPKLKNNLKTLSLRSADKNNVPNTVITKIPKVIEEFLAIFVLVDSNLSPQKCTVQLRVGSPLFSRVEVLSL